MFNLHRSGDDAAVSDVVANILMVAITIVMVVGIAAFISAQPGPQEHVNADIHVSTYPKLEVVHQGGVSLPLSDLKVIVQDANGTTSSNPVPLANYMASPGSTWAIGDVACLSCDSGLTGQDVTSVTVVGENAVVASWQGKLAVSSQGTGFIVPAPVATFTSKCTENLQCSFDASRSYSLDGSSLVYQWDFGTGTYTAKSFSPTTTHTFSSNGPHKVTLKVTSRNRVSDTETRTVHPLYMKYVQSFTATLGTLPDPITKAQHEDGKFYNISEAISGTSPDTKNTYAGDSYTSTPVLTTNAGAAWGTPDGVYAHLTATAASVTVHNFVQPSNATISRVKVGVLYNCANATKANGPADSVQLSYTASGVTPTPVTYQLGTFGQDVTRYFDLTNQTSSWTWAQVTSIVPTFEYIVKNQQDCSPMKVDAIWLHVRTTVNTYDLQVTGSMTQTTTAGAPHYLELSYLRSGPANYVVKMGGTQIGPTLSNDGLTFWRVQLTTAQYNGGNIQFTIQSASPVTTQSRLLLDYVRVVSS